MKQIEQGDILVATWGYDAAISDFYVVLKRTPKTVELAHLRTHEQPLGNYYTDGWSATPTDVVDGKPFRRRVASYDGEEYVGISSYANAYLWNGKPVHNFNWH